jgi:hypothetical protein
MSLITQSLRTHSRTYSLTKMNLLLLCEFCTYYLVLNSGVVICSVLCQCVCERERFCIVIVGVSRPGGPWADE